MSRKPNAEQLEEEAKNAILKEDFWKAHDIYEQLSQSFVLNLKYKHSFALLLHLLNQTKKSQTQYEKMKQGLKRNTNAGNKNIPPFSMFFVAVFYFVLFFGCRHNKANYCVYVCVCVLFVCPCFVFFLRKNAIHPTKHRFLFVFPFCFCFCFCFCF